MVAPLAFTNYIILESMCRLGAALGQMTAEEMAPDEARDDFEIPIMATGRTTVLWCQFVALTVMTAVWTTVLRCLSIPSSDRCQGPLSHLASEVCC